MFYYSSVKACLIMFWFTGLKVLNRLWCLLVSPLTSRLVRELQCFRGKIVLNCGSLVKTLWTPEFSFGATCME